MYKQTNIYSVVWVKDNKVRIQLGDHKHERLTIPLSVVDGSPKKNGQLRVITELDDEFNKQVLSAETPKRKHVCRNWRWVGLSSINVTLKCTTCCHSKTRPLTLEEVEAVSVNNGLDKLLDARDGKHVHSVWHDFQDKFYKDHRELKYRGWDLIEKIRVWAKDYPDDVKMVTVDDNAHATSILCLIEHKTECDYMGTTVIYAGQCGDAVEFFLYPENTNELISVLTALKRAARPIQQAEKKWREEEDKKLQELFKNG